MGIEDQRHRYDFLAVGASAGGAEAIRDLLRQLPPDLPLTVFIVLHQPIDHVSYLRDVLARHARLPVRLAQDGEPPRRGTCYLGTPSRHLALGADGCIHLVPDGAYRGRSIDVLFRSLAKHAGSRTIGVVLSGSLTDGTEGLDAVKQAGGWALVQRPDEALFPGMPINAIRHDGATDLVGSIAGIAAEICRLADRTPLAAADAK